ncbi:putative dape protein [Synechococcus sp. RS9916]|nr:putative dape protein [Synechococcus sp. RS9916]
MSNSQPFQNDPLPSATSEACAAERQSDDVALVANNLNTVLQSNTYRLAHEDQELLNSNEMRGVRMLLEISKPEMVLEAEQILLHHPGIWRRLPCGAGSRPTPAQPGPAKAGRTTRQPSSTTESQTRSASGGAFSLL